MEDAPKPDWPWCIPLRAKDGDVRAWALVDEEDFGRFGALACCLMPRGYALVMLPGGGRRGPGVRGPGTQMLLHRAVMGMAKGDGRAVDHVSGDKLDNRRANLRECTQAQNMQNKRGYGRTSRHRGVSWDKSRGRWIAYARVNGKTHHLGRHADEDEAARVAADFRRQHMAFAVDR